MSTLTADTLLPLTSGPSVTPPRVAKAEWIKFRSLRSTWFSLGAAMVVAIGLGVLAGQVWARTIGVLVAGLSAIVNFAFIPIYPVWSIAIIALDVAVIWALTVHGRDVAR